MPDVPDGSDGIIRNTFSNALGGWNEGKCYRRRTGNQRSCILFICTELSAKALTWQAEATTWQRRSLFSLHSRLFDLKQMALGRKFTLIAITAMLGTNVALR